MTLRAGSTQWDGTSRVKVEPRALLQTQPAPRALLSHPHLSPLGQQHNGVSGAVHQAHDGVAIVVPVDDQFAPTYAAHKPTHSNGRQARWVLGERHLEAVEEAQTVAHVPE